MATSPQVGKNVDSWCTRCKLVLAHTIETVLNGKITRVHCNTCGGQHAYRAKAPGTRSTTSRARKSSTDAAPAQDFQALLKGRTAADARKYALSDRFRPGEVISHATFGLGVVTAERDGVKIEVTFAEGPKVLVHGRVG
jgi:hypothetical protein